MYVIFFRFSRVVGDGRSSAPGWESDMHIVWGYHHVLRYIHHLCTKLYGLNQRAEGVFLPFSNCVAFFYTKMWGYHVDI